MKWILIAGVLAWGAQAQPQGRGVPANWRIVDAEAGRPGAVVTNAPFSADVTTETSMVLQDGNHIHQTSSTKVYRDSEGRTRREQSLNTVGAVAANTNTPTVVFINDPVAGANYALNPSAKTATRSGGRGPQGNRGGRPGPAMNAGMGRWSRGAGNRSGETSKTESLGTKQVEGVTAEGTRTTLTIPAGELGNEKPLQTVVETWYSPELQTVVLSKRSDPRTGETVTRYTNISRVEPPHSLFEVPADYKITDSGGRASRAISK